MGFRARLIYVVAFKVAVKSKATVGPVRLAPLNAIVRLVVAWVVGVAFDVDENNSSLNASKHSVAMPVFALDFHSTRVTLQRTYMESNTMAKVSWTLAV